MKTIKIKNFKEKKKLAQIINSAFAGLAVSSMTVSSIAMAQTEESGVEVIQVSGVRSSLDEARDIKRFSNTVVDAISAEDIGQFSDDSIAQAIQRIPGVQIETDDAGTDGDRVSIRGLGPEFVNSTINGRTLLSSGNEGRSLRKMNFNVFPPSVLSGVEVSKGQTADRPESGLAGQVNLQTLRPLSVKGLENGDITGNVSLRYEYEDLVGGTGNRINGLVVGKNDKGNLGGYIGLVLSDSELNRDQIQLQRISTDLLIDSDGDGVQDSTMEGVSAPYLISMNPIRSEPKRTAISTGLQYETDGGLQVVWDLMYSNYDNKSHRDNGQLLFDSSYASTVFNANSVEVDDQGLVTSLDYRDSTGDAPVSSRVMSLQYNNETENLITGINFDWMLNNTSVNLDLYYSEVDYAQDLRHSRMIKSLDNSQINVVLDGEIPYIEQAGIDEVDGYSLFDMVVRQIDLDGENAGVTLGLTTDIDHDVIRSIDYGVSYSNTELNSRRTKIGTSYNPEQADEIAAAALTGDVTPNDFLDDENFQPSSWLRFDLADIASVDPFVLETQFDDLGVDPAASHLSKEAITSLWGQVNFDTELGDTPVRGNVGLRAVYTDHSATAGVVISGADPVNETTGGDYWEFLPNVNFNIALTDSLALRLGFSKTLSRPDYEDMAPITSINVVSTETDIGVATSGNSDLNPMTAYNYDITLEYYNQYDGASVLSVFYKDVKDFIIDTTQYSTTIPGYDGVYDLTTAVNFSDGEASGIEVGIYQPFDKLLPALEGFGVSANYTYVDSSFDKDVGDAGFGFPGSSQDNFNFVGFYEADLFTVRLAYVYRGEFFRSLQGTGSQVDSARFTAAIESLDMNITYRVTDSFDLQLNGTNLTSDDRRDFVGYEANFLDYFARGRQFALTATYKF
ncbi:TonB-dependent receptor [Alteromonas sp. 14N.309.X.WAT.G.H12]|uniref:TonB-dependent receptor n=1 Tax=Alteromonas sp. 14N.309.X.WAT.G.H12 TaxID=3120824 RepID=UPI002FD41B9F